MRLVQQQDRSVAVHRARPQGVPEDAWWDPGRAQWMFGRVDDDGVPQGMWTFWDVDGGLAERAEYVDGRRNGPAWCAMTPGMFVAGDVVAARGRFEGDVPRGRWFLLDARGGVIEEFDYGPGLQATG